MAASAYFRESGSGEALVCLHSSASSSGQWRALMESFSNRYRVLAADLYGYGRSPEWPSDRDLLLEDEIELLAPMLQSAQRFHLIGHSYGGLVALKLALIDPSRVASLTLYEPTCFFLLAERADFDAARREIAAIREETSRLVDAGDPEASARQFVEYWVGPGAWQKTPDTARATVIKGMRKVRFEWVNGFDRPFPVDSFSALKMPALFLTGSRSTAAARGVVQVLRDRVPHAEVRELPDLGHMGPITHPDVVNSSVAAFLERIQGTTRVPRSRRW
jgi:pimeloyl-ACP methyl ester carboxylesterase